VLPVFNESEGIESFHAQLTAAVARRPELSFEFVYVDDGSTDDSMTRLLALRQGDPRVTVLGLSRNFGHQIAITAGLDAVLHHDATIIMDTDLQDPPAVSLELIEAWEKGADVVYAQRRTRKDSTSKRVTAAAYYWLLARIANIDIPRDVGDFRLLDRAVVTAVARYRERDRFMRGIVAHVGFRQEAVLFDRDARQAGVTHYGWRRMFKLAADGILGFSTAPLRLISRIGLVISLLSLSGALFVVYYRLFRPEESVPGWAFLAVGMFLLGGIQLLMLGVVGSYLGRIYVETQARPLYSLALAARDPLIEEGIEADPGLPRASEAHLSGVPDPATVAGRPPRGH